MRSNLQSSVHAMGQKSGGFALARYVTRQNLRILCYHGVWAAPEQHFGDALFMSPATFEARMRMLRDSEYSILPLNEALALQDAGNLPDRAVAITIDDGFHHTWKLMLPILENCGLSATIYVTTHYMLTGGPVTPLLLRYTLERSPRRELNLGQCIDGAKGIENLDNEPARRRAIAQLSSAFSRKPRQDREAAHLELGHQLGIDLSSVLSCRQFELMSADEVRDSIARGFDIQLHTHRHRTSVNGKCTLPLEIEQNRKILEPLTECRLRHFCYPSGIHALRDLSILRAAGVTSATTCLPGHNSSKTHRLKLRRTLDAESVKPLAFEAELSGFNEILRHGHKRVIAGAHILRAPQSAISAIRTNRKLKQLAGAGDTAKVLVLACTVAEISEVARWLSLHFELMRPREAIEFCRAGGLDLPTACLVVDVRVPNELELARRTLADIGIIASLFVNFWQDQAGLISAIDDGHEIGLRLANSTMNEFKISHGGVGLMLEEFSSRVGKTVTAVVLPEGETWTELTNPTNLGEIGIEHAYIFQPGCFSPAMDPLQISCCRMSPCTENEFLSRVKQFFEVPYSIIPSRGYDCTKLAKL